MVAVRQHDVAGDAQSLVLIADEEVLDLHIADLAERPLCEDDVAHDALDGGIIDDELAVIAEDRPDDRLLAQAAPPRRGALEERLERIDEVAGKMRLELNRRHRDDVLPLFDAVEARLLHL